MQLSDLAHQITNLPLHEADEPREGQWRFVDFTHEQTLQNDRIELASSSPDKETVQLHKFDIAIRHLHRKTILTIQTTQSIRLGISRVHQQKYDQTSETTPFYNQGNCTRQGSKINSAVTYTAYNQGEIQERQHLHFTMRSESSTKTIAYKR